MQHLHESSKEKKEKNADRPTIFLSAC